MKRNKALLSTVFLSVGLTLAACGSSQNASAEANTEISEEVATEETGTEAASTDTESESRLSLGDTASTDIAEFTLEKAEFTIALENTQDVSTSLLPKEYDSSKDSNNPFVAGKGYTLVALTFDMKNTDRNGLSTGGGGISEWNFIWNVTYNNETYPLTNLSISKNSGYFALLPNCAVFNDSTKDYSITGYYLEPEETVKVRTFGMIATDVENLTDSFDLTIIIPNSKGEYEAFVYSVSDKDGANN